ncbi:bifunctional phosphoribosylaminoimidazolecarboxamide formyltransferase/IMP cyclohydrolase [Candidatus Peregrinibacteria bacterium]|nr:bifunctional phosphoribosylaminoimidazolecarboxamide formyltransferase/IMP cyclohydrolase [Candidatus Peregrinibacteria bacterium]
MIKRALISVSDKTGLAAFVKKLEKKKIEIISTGGTAKVLRDAGIVVTDVSEHTGFPEIMDGRVKTLHPKIHGGLLAVRDNEKHMEEAQKNGIGMIDLVVVNLYPFEKTIEREGISEAEAIEQIDIGGPSMLRSAAKNFEFVTVVTDPMDYDFVAAEIEKTGDTFLETRKNLAWKVFERTANYDRAIANYFRGVLGKPELLELHYEKVCKLRYGENPHQKAAFFRNPLNHDANVTNAKVLHGKELSFNNIVDANSALELVKEFEKPSVAFIKHNNPCGVASADTIEKAFDLSFNVDTKSAFGSVIALNRPVTKAVAQYIKKNRIFVELIICPSFEPDALKMLMERPNLRLLETGELKLDIEKRDIKKVAGGILVQTANTYTVTERDLKVVTKAQPTEQEIRAMLFANKVCKHVMSNSVVFAKSENGRDFVTGVGAGQMSRVDSVWIAAKKGGERAKGSVMASDAFFPFPDGVEEAAKAGTTAIISPGGSVKDAEVIEVADKLGIAMVFSGIRLFRH